MQVDKLKQACEAEDTWPGPCQSQSIFDGAVHILPDWSPPHLCARVVWYQLCTAALLHARLLWMDHCRSNTILYVKLVIGTHKIESRFILKAALGTWRRFSCA